MITKSDWPLFVYLYDASDHYSEPIEIRSDFALQLILKTAVLEAVCENRQVRITDSDDFLVFHAENGKVLFPTEVAHLFEKGGKRNGEAECKRPN